MKGKEEEEKKPPSGCFICLVEETRLLGIALFFFFPWKVNLHFSTSEGRRNPPSLSVFIFFSLSFTSFYFFPTLVSSFRFE